ncbi:hypothetical protein PR048_018041 [Dryococelus australis]|uniref:Secreted protein n=1 Tax=Dryococelus australis TaxID=614101 RepID=A0ABQ9HBR6_9NEOP|nr:hypothetical protein PR048_018041 [Dryococelus australis]
MPMSAVSWLSAVTVEGADWPTVLHECSNPGRVTPDFRKWESCRTMSLVGGFSRGSPVPPAFGFRRCSSFTSFHSHRLSISHENRPNISTQFCNTEVSEGRRRNARAREMEDARESPPTSVRHDSYMGNSGSDPTGNRTRFALEGGFHSSRRATVAPT